MINTRNCLNKSVTEIDCKLPSLSFTANASVHNFSPSSPTNRIAHVILEYYNLILEGYLSESFNHNV